MAATVSNQKILNDGETVDGGLMAPCRRGESADSEISSDVSSDERFINKCVPPPRAFANSKENKDEGGKRRGTPKLDCRLAKSSSDAASAPPSPRTRSLDISSLGNRTSFRIQGIDGEFDEIWPSLGLSGPDDFSTPAAACEARKFRSSLDLPQRSRLHQKILNDDETVDGGLMAPCRRGESADSEISSNVSSDERFINKYVPPPRAFANSKENKDEGVCSFVDSMTSISSTDFDALDNRAHLGRAYHSGPIVFNSEKKDTREGLSGECLIKSALSFDDSTKRKSLPVDVNLSSFSEHASQDFDDFDFVGFDYGAGMLPNLMDELDSLREKPLVDFDAPNIKAHGLLVSNSEEKNTREASTTWCMTESVCSLVDSMPSISSTDFDALDNRSHLGRAYQSGPIVFNSEQKDTREGLSGQWLTKSAPSFDDKQKLLLDVRILASSLELTSQDLYDIGDFDDFDGFDHCAGRLPNLEDEDWATMKGYSLGDKRPVEVISLSTHPKLVLRLQLIYISWLGRFSPRPSALVGGGEIGGPIALSLSESAATKNIAQHVGQDQSGSAASDSENERTREQGDPEEINATITLHDIRRHYGRRNREDAAASLAISISTFKRKCREYGIKRWPHVRKRKVGRPPDQHGEGNTSTARETPSHYVQTGMEGELVGQNEVANVFQRDFMGGPIALNTESGLIMVSRPPDQHGERNTSTACRTPSRNVETGMEVEPVGQNQEANVFHGDFMYGPIALNTDGLTFPECSDAVAPSQPMSTILDTIPHLTGSSSECAFQVKNQSTQFTANPYPNGLVDPHPQIALTQILSENMERLEDRRNLLAPQKEPLPEGHVFGSVNWTVRSCSDVALSQPMPTIPHTTGCSEYWRNSLALLEEHLLEENDYGSINLTAPSCFDPGPSQPMHTIPHTMPTIPQMIPLLTERQDMRSVRLKATYGNTIIKFPLPSGFSELKEEVSKRLEFERGSFKLEYKDEEGDSVLIACDEDLRDYLQLLTSLGNQVVKLFVLDKVPNTTNFCDNCRSLKCKRT